MTVLVTGDRNWEDREMIRDVLREYPDDTLIHGDARGADRLAGQEGRAFGMSIILFPARWTEHGKAAGPIRNQEMLMALLAARDQGRDVVVHAFHDDLNHSKGTLDMVNRARRRGISVKLHTHRGVVDV